MKTIKNYLIAGILVLVPIWITFSILDYLIRTFDQIIALIPDGYQPQTLLGFSIPGLGLLLVLTLVFVTGMLATNFIGTYIINFWEVMLAKIPLVRSIHAGVKQVLSTMLGSGGQSFRKVLLIEYPRKGMWALAFQTGSGLAEIDKQIGKKTLTVFVPTTPNPTGGFLLVIPSKDVIELKMSVDDALKLIISLGVILPHHKEVKRKRLKGRG